MGEKFGTSVIGGIRKGIQKEGPKSQQSGGKKGVESRTCLGTPSITRSLKKEKGKGLLRSRRQSGCKEEKKVTRKKRGGLLGRRE